MLISHLLPEYPTSHSQLKSFSISYNIQQIMLLKARLHSSLPYWVLAWPAYTGKNKLEIEQASVFAAGNVHGTFTL